MLFRSPPHKAAITSGAGGDAGDHRPWRKGLRRAACDFKDLCGGQRRAAADAAELGLAIEVALVSQTRIEITAFALQAFAPRAVITRITTRAARDSSLVVTFEAFPYAETVYFRPPLLAKPQIAGTVPARVTSPDANYLYADLDEEGRYRVNFLFDRDTWKPGRKACGCVWPGLTPVTPMACTCR